MKIKVNIFLVIFFYSGSLMSQIKKTISKSVSDVTIESKIIAVSSVVKNGIAFRWAPNNERAWLEINKYGYVVEKYTVMRDGKMLSKVEKRIVKNLKPMPLKSWDSTILNKDDYAAVIAQSLYGESFEMIMQDKQSVQSLVSLSKEKQQRFAMAMYAADHSFQAARMAGLGWYDNAVKQNEKYLYRIYSSIPANILKSDTAKIFIGLTDDKILPKPADILPQAGDKVVMLTWEFDNFADFYGSYYLEKSDDQGKTFYKVSDRPVTKLSNSSEAATNGSMVYSDTLINNVDEFKYRIAGLTLFDEVGPYSEIVTVKGVPKIETAPHIIGLENVKEGKGVLIWEIEDSVVNLIKNFELSTSSIAEGPYKTIISNIDVSKRSIQLDSISSEAAYLTITAVVKAGENKTSMPFLLQAEDSLAPAIPKGLEAKIDSNGVVRINWIQNTEKDLKGYKLYKTLVKDQELTIMMDSVWQTNSYIDTVELKTLNSTVYYSLRAVDKRYNQSDYAPTIAVKKPDVVPPSQPVFKDYQFKDTAVVLNWINSYDDDLKYTTLLRKNLADSANKWEEIMKIDGNTITSFIDTKGEGGSSYGYTLISFDSSELQSLPSVPITLTIPTSFNKSAIKKIDAEVDREKRNITIIWDIVSKQNVTQVELYKATEKEKISLYKIFEGKILNYVDDNLKVNTSYQYGIRAVFEDGKTSDIKIKKINY